MQILRGKVQSDKIKNRHHGFKSYQGRICEAFLIVLPLLWIMTFDTIIAAEKRENSSQSSGNKKNQRMKSEFFKISVDVNLVTTDVTVVGKPLSPLNAEDFIVYDNTAVQEVTHFSYDQFPIAVAFLIDRSGSVTDFFPRLQIASLLALRNLKPEDQVALFSFAQSCTQQVKLTIDRLSIAEKISAIRVDTTIGKRTNIYGALRETARYLLENAPDRQRAIILVSDNRHNTPDPDMEKVLHELMEASVTLYSIRIRPIPRPIFIGLSLVATKEKIPNASKGVAGKWLIKDRNTTRKLYLKVEGTKVTGTLNQSGWPEPMTIKDGKLKGDKISFYVERKMNGRDIKIPWTGTLSGDQIKFLCNYQIAFPAFLKTVDSDNHDLKDIVERTGGELLKVEAGTSLQTALSEAVKNIRYRYTIGFNPSDPGEDGSYHKLLVKLAAQERCPECKLRTRNGYYVGGAAPVLSRKENPPTLKESAGKTDELLIQRSIATAGTTKFDLQDVPFTVKTIEQPKRNGQPQLTVQLNIDPAGIGFNTIEGRHTYNLQIAIFYAARSGKVLDYDWKKLKGRFNTEDYKRIINEGVLYTTHLTGKVEEPILKVVVYDEVNNSIGSKFVTLARDRDADRRQYSGFRATN